MQIDNIPPCSAAPPEGAFPWLLKHCPWDKVQIPSHGAGLSTKQAKLFLPWGKISSNSHLKPFQPNQLLFCAL